jgi:hypothetical protein
MKTIQLIKQQHKEVDKLFAAIEKAEDTQEKKQLFDRVAAMLVAHDAIEREIFYPACEKRLGLDDVVGEALVEHGLMEFSLYQADLARGKKGFDFRLSVLSEVVKHHVKEEEHNLLPEIAKELDADTDEELYAMMKSRFDMAVQSDFRAPLRANLEQVLQGALKTAPPEPTPKKAPATRRVHNGASPRATR